MKFNECTVVLDFLTNEKSAENRWSERKSSRKYFEDIFWFHFMLSVSGEEKTFAWFVTKLMKYPMRDTYMQYVIFIYR